MKTKLEFVGFQEKPDGTQIALFNGPDKSTVTLKTARERFGEIETDLVHVLRVISGELVGVYSEHGQIFTTNCPHCMETFDVSRPYEKEIVDKAVAYGFEVIRHEDFFSWINQQKEKYANGRTK